MATIVDILSSKWPGAQWAIKADDYDTLEWLDKSEKPTLEAIRAVSDLVDVELAERAALRAREKEFLASAPDPIYSAIKTLTEAVQKLQEQVLALNPDAQISTDIDTLATKTRG